MSMQLLTLLQLLYILVLYIGVVILIPAAVFHSKFEDHPFYVRYVAYTCIGNFFLMNLVFVLQLLKISNRATLILGVIIPALLGIAAFHWQEWVKATLVTAGETTHNVMVNTMGFRLFFVRIFQNIGQAFTTTVKAIAENLVNRWFDWVGTIAIIAVICWQYGGHLFEVFGYTTSDMLVHNQWINAMGNNDIFTSGVYPYGFHCIIYFFHAVFGIKTYVLLRLFSLVQTLLIHMTLLFLLRLVCKTESAAYVATGFFLLLNIWGENAYVRYYSTLPQEYGMIFILPAIFFLILFFRGREEEEGTKGIKVDSTRMLRLFSICVSMTLAVHFYDTIALGILCVAIGLAFCRVVFKKENVGRIIYAGAIGLVIAVLPMLIAYVGGTPMQGSLRWGINVIEDKGYQDDLIDVGLDQSRLYEDKELWEQAGAGFRKQIANVAAAVTATLSDGGQGMLSDGGQGTQRADVKIAGSIFHTMQAYLAGYVFISKHSSFGVITLVLIAVGIALGVITLFREEKEQGRMLLAASMNMIFFSLLLVARELHLPVLMDKNRTSIYVAFFLIILLGMIMDFFIDLGIGLIEGDILKKISPAIFAVVCFVFLGLAGWIRQPAKIEAFQKNGAVICLTNILRDNEPKTFNIISANDEIRMAEEYGYHYEAHELLLQNMGFNVNNYLVVPSSRVYVFIEKIPGDYDAPYEGSGRPLSRESASKPLPFGSGIDVYKGENRHVVMSKLYYWAQIFASMYENEISVYYEDDEFVCYEIRQSVDRPFDMSFEYGYNN